ncbi:MAG: phosphoribosylformylglycinamidine cyclo-ligase [Candidatus Omnitrophica bacterium]|nr:phosphoribosylformylglycinamidine cyclo-ligase [Candidatus Omnitrophota bacterium]
MKTNWTYEKAGVPHLKGDPGYNREIVKLIRSTHTPGVLGSATGFAALFDYKKSGVKNPLLVSSTDGVGTKLEIARLQNRHDTIGIDLVAMCVNDIITCGAKPVFFLDYFATGKFDPKLTREVLKGIAAGCREAGCALVGGETAVMPGFYHADKKFSQYDVAGFSVGVVDRKKVIHGKKIRKGDMILGLASSGFHSNGYSLLRKVFRERDLRGKLGKELLTPTRIYVKPVLKVLEKVPVHGIVNITGGGFIDNLPRVIPAGLGATIYTDAWPIPRLFDFVRDSGNISDFEMMRTFNLGIGMVFILNKNQISRAQTVLYRNGISSWVIGKINPGRGVKIL